MGRYLTRLSTYAFLTVIGVSNNVWAATRCAEYVQYVCGKRDGVEKTYVNSCFARKDGATIVHSGRCEAWSNSSMKFCPEVFLPVCASKDGLEKTYGNACFALADGAVIEHKGPCGSQK
jgi:hypothetical protein